MLRHLRDNVYCRLAPSTVQGVGVFAVRDIARAVEPFRSYRHRSFPQVTLSDEQMRSAGVPEPVIGLIHSFLVNNGDTDPVTYPVIDLNAMDISFYINHDAERCNVKFSPCTCKTKRGCGFDHIITTKMIKAGEELFLDYHKECVNPADKFE